ncbi:uncharacterized protein LOC128959819 [Oppia nitens]|uniref:uncharacterized protein LOC128959819 n=1 Tax=Oppia nitens TaxID=1686743 RepID=UPI0023DC556F|nr:uncharacterized protein LOC128959819 [Oppia nitens]
MDKILRCKQQPINSDINIAGAYVWDKLNQLGDDFVCLIDAATDQRLTVGELKILANSIAWSLVNIRGVTKADRIAFCGPNTMANAVLRFVVQFIGVTFVPLVHVLETYEITEQSLEAGITVIMTTSDHLYKFDNIINSDSNNRIKLVVLFDNHQYSGSSSSGSGGSSNISSSGSSSSSSSSDSNNYVTYDQLLDEGRGQQLARIPHYDVDPDTDRLLYIYTSGSTGRPKCALIPHSMFVRTAQEPGRYPTFADTVTVMAFPFPLGHMAGSMFLLIQITKGFRLILFDKLDEKMLFAATEKYQINVWPVLGSFGHRLVNSDAVGNYDLSSIRWACVGGAPLASHIGHQLIRIFGLKIKESYASTEQSYITQGCNDDDDYEPGNLGTVVPGCELKVVDMETGELLGANCNGEIFVKSIKLFAGFLNNYQQYRQSFDADGWYTTGDMGYYDDRERVFLTGRVKFVIKVGVNRDFLKIDPIIVEEFLLSHPSIAEVAVVGVGVKDTAGFHYLRAYVVRKPGQKNITADDIQQFVSNTMASSKHLRAGVVFVDEIHRTVVGKVDRQYYRKLVSHEIVE